MKSVVLQYEKEHNCVIVNYFIHVRFELPHFSLKKKKKKRNKKIEGEGTWDRFPPVCLLPLFVNFFFPTYQNPSLLSRKQNKKKLLKFFFLT